MPTCALANNQPQTILLGQMDSPNKLSPMPKPTSEDRLQKIESHLAQLERLYEQLNQVVIEQEKTLHRLHLQQQRLSKSMETMELERIKATNPRPPHHQ
jgi:uncharacterized coiled-coil protein SlyX